MGQQEKKAQMEIKDYYDRFSDAWLNEYGSLIQTSLFADKPKDFAQVMMGRAMITPQHSVLDVGCGVGGVMLGLMENGVLDVTGVTLSSRQIELGRELDADLNIELADFMEWDDRGRKFDRIIFCESFGYFTEPSKLIDKIRGLLAPGGMVYVKDLCAVNDPDLMQQVGLEAIGNLWRWYNIYTTQEMAWMWGMRRIGGGDNLWRETSCRKFIEFVMGNGSFAKAHGEELANAGMKQQPAWNGQVPVKTSDFLFA